MLAWLLLLGLTHRTLARTRAGGLTRHHRMTLAPESGRVIQTGEHSDDAGKTWSRDFQLTYVRKAA